MASLTAIRAALVTVISAEIADLHVYNTVPDSGLLPAVVIQPSTADFTVAMGRGTDTWELQLFVMVSPAVPQLAQDTLDDYVTGAGPKSIRAALFRNRDLGLDGVDAHVSGMSGYGGSHDWAGIDHIGAILHVTVHTRGTE